MYRFSDTIIMYSTQLNIIFSILLNGVHLNGFPINISFSQGLPGIHGPKGFMGLCGCDGEKVSKMMIITWLNNILLKFQSAQISFSKKIVSFYSNCFMVIITHKVCQMIKVTQKIVVIGIKCRLCFPMLVYWSAYNY